MTRLVTLEVSVRIVFAAVMVGSLCLLFAGHNQPGGGFVGGLVAGAAVALRYVSRRHRRGPRGCPRSQPWTVLGAGAADRGDRRRSCRCCSAARVLESASLDARPARCSAHVKVTTALAFDIGVYLVVVGLVLMVFESFGDDPPPRTAAEPRPEEVAP